MNEEENNGYVVFKWNIYESAGKKGPVIFLDHFASCDFGDFGLALKS